MTKQRRLPCWEIYYLRHVRNLFTFFFYNNCISGIKLTFGRVYLERMELHSGDFVLFFLFSLPDANNRPASIYKAVPHVLLQLCLNSIPFHFIFRANFIFSISIAIRDQRIAFYAFKLLASIHERTCRNAYYLNLETLRTMFR